jgi:hypothetical protein
LENLDTHSTLIVGSECIRNFGVVLLEWRWSPYRIAFPTALRAYTRWLRTPEEVVQFDHSPFFEHANADFLAVVNSAVPPEEILHFVFVRTTRTAAQRELTTECYPEPASRSKGKESGDNLMPDWLRGTDPS